ncbi:MAG: NTP transferase domain-containing protein [Flavobacteriales bacterium]|nr:NTP transferase domain-containing protein [Flavobacteriales bacterium]
MNIALGKVKSMNNLIGLFPAAGRGSRLGNIPCSKEIMPLGFQFSGNKKLSEEIWHPVTAIEAHLAAFRSAGVQQVGIVIGPTKWDIMRYLSNGEDFGLPIAYFYQEHLRGMPYALDLAFSWVQDSAILFSMPDTLITPDDAMAKLVAHHRLNKADVTLGLFPTDNPHKFGMVELDSEGDIVNFVDKPEYTNLEMMWGCAVWSAKFTHFMHKFLSELSITGTEIVLSDVFLAALKQGLSFTAFPIKNGKYHDIGTPESFQTAVYQLALQQMTDDIAGNSSR